MKKYRFLFAALLLALTVAPVRSQVPQLLNYQGRVAVDAVNFEGTGQFKFALVNSDGTTTYWSNDGTSTIGDEPAAAVPLAVAKGLYSVLLGDDSLSNMVPVPASVFANSDVRLRVWFDDGANGSQLLAPDQRIAAVGYAMVAGDVSDGAITAAKIAPGSITGDRLAPATVDATNLFSLAAPNAGETLTFDGANLVWAPVAGGGGDSVFSLNGTSAYYLGGNVGIGTANPSMKFVIAQPGIVQYGFSGAYIRSGYLGEGGGFLNSGELDVQGGWTDNNGGRIRLGGGARGDTDRNVIQFLQNTTERMRINDGGFVGIGTSVPLTKVHLFDPVNSVSHRIQTGGGTNSWSRVEFANANGQWNVGTSRGFFGDAFYISQNNLPISFQIDGGGFSSKFNVADFYLGHASRRGAPGRAMVDWVNPANNMHQLVVNFASDWAETVIGGAVTEVKALRITGGADLAEPFAMSRRDVEPGTVVVIDTENPGKLCKSATAYDRKVAGIVSGANGVRPGISMIQEDTLEAGENVALSGRVYVKANASAGPIEPGDLLTTSEIPGEAMKVADHTRAQGAILGKAMTALADGSGTVLVLVTLQ